MNLSLITGYAHYSVTSARPGSSLSQPRYPQEEQHARSTGEASQTGNRIRLALIALLFAVWIVLLLELGRTFPLFLLGAVISWVIGFLNGRSTKVFLNPQDAPFSPRVQLSYYDFHRWAHQIIAVMMNRHLLENPRYHWTSKMTLLMESTNASNHVWALSLSLLLLAAMNVVLGLVVFSPDAEERLLNPPPGPLGEVGPILFGAVAAITVGYACGLACGWVYRWLRANW